MGKENTLTLTSHHAQNQFSVNADQNIKDKIIQLLTFSINIEPPHDLGVGNDFLHGTQKEITINKTNVKLSFININNY